MSRRNGNNRETYNARIIQDATGARYNACLLKLRNLRAKGEDDAYLDRIEAIPEPFGDRTLSPLCLDCLQPRHPGKCA